MALILENISAISALPPNIQLVFARDWNSAVREMYDAIRHAPVDAAVWMRPEWAYPKALMELFEYGRIYDVLHDTDFMLYRDMHQALKNESYPEFFNKCAHFKITQIRAEVEEQVAAIRTNMPWTKIKGEFKTWQSYRCTEVSPHIDPHYNNVRLLDVFAGNGPILFAPNAFPTHAVGNAGKPFFTLSQPAREYLKTHDVVGWRVPSRAAVMLRQLIKADGSDAVIGDGLHPASLHASGFTTDTLKGARRGLLRTDIGISRNFEPGW
jgi:hypothetical protein